MAGGRRTACPDPPSASGPQLHKFIPQFGIAFAADRVAVEIDGPHALLSSWLPTGEDGHAVFYPAQKGRYELQDRSIVQGFESLGSLQLSVISIFPSSLFTCIRNAWSFRRMIPTGPGSTDIEYTWFGYEGESEYELECRRRQCNLLGPAGYVAMEDAEVLEMVQNAIGRGDTSFIGFGEAGIGDADHFNTETSIRALWRGRALRFLSRHVGELAATPGPARRALLALWRHAHASPDDGCSARPRGSRERRVIVCVIVDRSRARSPHGGLG